MLIAGRNGMVGGKHYTAKDYVQDGLVAMWDGIENAGWDVHDPNATVWTNLAGGPNLTQGSTRVSWSEDSCVFRENTYMNNWFPEGYNTVLTGNWTIETIYSITDVSSVNASVFGLGTNRTLWVFANNGADIQSDKLANAMISGAGKANLGRRFCITATGDGRVYVNGEFVISRGTSSLERRGNNFFSLGRLPNFRDNMIGEICNVKIYSRNFPSDEIAYTYAVDKARFNLDGGGGV